MGLFLRHQIEASTPVFESPGEPFLLTLSFDPVTFAFAASLDSGASVEFAVSGDLGIAAFQVRILQDVLTHENREIVRFFFLTPVVL